MLTKFNWVDESVAFGLHVMLVWLGYVDSMNGTETEVSLGLNGISVKLV